MLLNPEWKENIAFTPDQLLIGTGWHEVEKEGDTFVRWTGPDTASTIHLSPRRDIANRLNLTIHQASCTDNLTALHLEADGVPLHTTTTISRDKEPAFATAVLPVDASKKWGEQTIITLEWANTLPSKQVLPKSKNSRKIGIAIRRIDIFPLRRSMFTAQKYDDPVPFDGLNYIRINPGIREAVVHNAYNSAYEYFIKNDRAGTRDVFRLHENFDECPGDLYDILHADMIGKCQNLEQKYMEEINNLRNMVYRQGEMIRELKKK